MVLQTFPRVSKESYSLSKTIYGCTVYGSLELKSYFNVTFIGSSKYLVFVCFLTSAYDWFLNHSCIFLYFEKVFHAVELSCKVISGYNWKVYFKRSVFLLFLYFLFFSYIKTELLKQYVIQLQLSKKKSDGPDDFSWTVHFILKLSPVVVILEQLTFFVHK